MPSSDEDFESADEGHGTPEKIARKKRHSSSNYSDNALETDKNTWNLPTGTSKDKKPAEKEVTDGWDDFDIGDTEPIETKATDKKNITTVTSSQSYKEKKDTKTSQDTGWDDFDDWGDDSPISNKKEVPLKPLPPQPEPDIKAVTEKLAAASPGGSGWGWGWSVDSLLSTATAGISSITNQVSQGISTVLETGIGAPDPEELARKTSQENRAPVPRHENDDATDKRPEKDTEDKIGSGEATFPFGGLLSGVTKFVESTGTKVISGGLDTLETIGKKTMEVLQDGDPGLAKKRALLGLGTADKPVLSQVLREAKAKADDEDKVREEKREAKEVHYENLFDDYEGLVHLEALEMLSRQVSMRIEERLRTVDPAKRQDVKETLQQVAELCEMPEEEEEDEEEESPDQDTPKAEAFHDRLQTATRDLGLKLHFQPLVKQYSDIVDWLSKEDSTVTEKTIYKRAVSSLAQTTALSVEMYHKAAEMLLVNSRRSTADEADALTQMTVVLTKHIGEMATLFTEKLNGLPTEDKELANNYITNIFLEAGNSSTYVQNAFQLALPILQIGAV